MAAPGELGEGGFIPPIDTTDIDDMHLDIDVFERSISERESDREARIAQLQEEIEKVQATLDDELDEYRHRRKELGEARFEAAKQKLVEVSEEVDGRHTDEAYWIFASYLHGPDEAEKRKEVFDKLVALRQVLGEPGKDRPVPVLATRESQDGGNRGTIRSLSMAISLPVVEIKPGIKHERFSVGVITPWDKEVVLDGEFGLPIPRVRYGSSGEGFIAAMDTQGYPTADISTCSNLDDALELKITDGLLDDIRSGGQKKHQLDILRSIVASRKLLGLEVNKSAKDLMIAAYIAQNPDILEIASLADVELPGVKRVEESQ